jgi:hypothetical protein
MTKSEDTKITIKFKEKEYEIEKDKKEQKIKPKGEATGTEITVKNYEEGGFLTSYKCECSEDGTTFEKIDIKWGAKKHLTIWGSGLIILASIGMAT